MCDRGTVMAFYFVLVCTGRRPASLHRTRLRGKLGKDGKEGGEARGWGEGGRGGCVGVALVNPWSPGTTVLYVREVCRMIS